MALIDAKEYYYTMLNQYLEAKNDLADFEQALKEGHITEDKLESVKEDVLNLKANLDRIQYIFYLINIPKRKEKKKRFLRANTQLSEYFKQLGVDTKSMTDENTDILTHLRAEIKKNKSRL